MQSFVNSKPAPPVGFDAVQEVERLKCDRDKQKEKSKQVELDLRRMESKLLELYTSWPKFAFGISPNANSLSSDINEEKRHASLILLLTRIKETKLLHHLKVQYLL